MLLFAVFTSSDTHPWAGICLLLNVLALMCTKTGFFVTQPGHDGLLTKQEGGS